MACNDYLQLRVMALSHSSMSKNEDNNINELSHYGVKGQKWGVINAKYDAKDVKSRQKANLHRVMIGAYAVKKIVGQVSKISPIKAKPGSLVNVTNGKVSILDKYDHKELKSRGKKVLATLGIAAVLLAANRRKNKIQEAKNNYNKEKALYKSSKNSKR